MCFGDENLSEFEFQENEKVEFFSKETYDF